MAIDRRRKNTGWNILDEYGSWYPGSYAGASLAVLMDIRDELQTLNRLLACQNFVGIPATLRAIQRNTKKDTKK